MAFKPGHKKVGGRVKGTPNKKTCLAEDMAKEMGVDPFKLLLMFCGNKFEDLGYSQSIPMDLRLSAIKDACNYIIPKRKTIELQTDSTPDLPARPFAMPNPKEDDEE